jgi:hypothetical protein
MHGRREIQTFSPKMPEVRRPLGRSDVDEKMILRWILKEIGWEDAE